MKSLKAKLIICSINVIVIVFLGISLTLGWFANGDSIGSMGFSILKINSTVTMYQGNDVNYNGIPDVLDTSNMYRSSASQVTPDQEYSNLYYTEIYDFTYVDEKSALSETSEANLLNSVTINNMFPSRTYVYKFSLANKGDAETTIKFSFAGKNSLATDYMNVLKYFEARINIVDLDGNIIAGDWKSFADVLNEETSTVGELTLTISSYNEGKILLPSISTSPDEYIKDIWLQVRLSASATNDIANKSIDLPKFSIYFQVLSED